MKMMRIVGGLFVCSLLSACTGNYDRTQETQLAKYSQQEIRAGLKEKVSTKRDVLVLLGVPETPTDYNASSHWTYHSKTIDQQFYLFIPVISNRTQDLVVNFTPAGVLSDFHYTER
ncbi:hypothetical protein GJV06_14230 [Enterobacteriaceae bacterium RIT691]|nr:hypothetical protein [Enterobacteriaceae bacterium RIT691]